MKKRTTMLALLLATGAGTCLQAQEKLTQFKVRDAITVRTPIMNDSINPKGEKYADKDLLKTPVVLDLADAPFQVLSTDTAGVLSFPKAEKDHSIYVLIGDLLACRTLHDREIESHFTRPLGDFYQRRIKNVKRKC